MGSGDLVHAQCAMAVLQQAKREGFPIVGIPYLNGTYHTMFPCQDVVGSYTGTGRATAQCDLPDCTERFSTDDRYYILECRVGS